MILVSSTANATSSSVATHVTNAGSGQPIVTPAVSSLPIPTNRCEFKIDLIEKQISKKNQEIVTNITLVGVLRCETILCKMCLKKLIIS